MPTVVDTVGSASANSYLSVASATSLLDERLGIAAWTDATADDKARAVIMATREIDSFRYVGYKISQAQALEWPRTEQVEASDTIPVYIQRACAEQALWVLQNSDTGGRSERQALQAQGVTEYSVGNLSEKLSGKFTGSSICPEALRYLRSYISRTGRIIGPRDTGLYENCQEAWRTGPFSP